MPTEDGLPGIGDVIVSEKFKYAERSDTRNMLRILNLAETATAQISLPEHNGHTQTRSTVAHGAGGDAYDSTRATAEFVVEEARWSDNPVTKSSGACSGRWYVSARRLTKDGSSNPNGERIAFFLCGLPDKFVLSPCDIKIIGTFAAPKKRGKK